MIARQSKVETGPPRLCPGPANSRDWFQLFAAHKKEDNAGSISIGGNPGLDTLASLVALHFYAISNPKQSQVDALLLLSDLPTPSFVLDVRAMQQRHAISPPSPFPSLHLPKHGVILQPLIL